MLKAFRTISLLEGFSYLVILSVTFNLISRDYVFSLGMLHGVLFMFYLVFSLLVSNKRGWSILVWGLLFLASLIPFAFILVEMYLRKIKQDDMQQPESVNVSANL
jgi:integral membrane protein